MPKSPNKWRPVSKMILAVLLAMLLSLFINVVSGFQKITLRYGLAVVALLAASSFTGYYSWKLADAQTRISYAVSTSSKPPSPTALSKHENKV